MTSLPSVTERYQALRPLPSVTERYRGYEGSEGVKGVKGRVMGGIARPIPWSYWGMPVLPAYPPCYDRS